MRQCEAKWSKDEHSEAMLSKEKQSEDKWSKVNHSNPKVNQSEVKWKKTQVKQSEV